MKAAVCREFSKPLVIEDVDLAPPQAGEIRVKLAATAICHSDIFYLQGAWGGSLPAVFGHEAAGVVEEVGAGVSHVAVGDHVVVTLIRFCGTCASCAEGAQVFCEATFPLDAQSPLSRGAERLVHGLRTGAFAEYVVVEASQAVAIDKDVPLDSAALIACGVITGMGAVINTAGVTAGKSVVVIDCGGVGSKMGSSRIRIDIPKIVELYKQGRIKLDELISGRYPLVDINAAIDSVVKGEALRNVIVF